MSATFNESVILKESWTEEDWRVELTGPLSPYELSWRFLSAPILMVPTENLTVWFEVLIDENRQFFGNGSEVLKIHFDDLEVMNSFQYNFGMINSTVEFELFPRESDEK